LNINELKNLAESLLETFFNAGQKSIELRKKGLKTIFKSDSSPVTNGDLEVDKLLREKIIRITPNIPLVSEETVNLNKNNGYKNFWLVDPIDGTKEYINNEDEFTLNASLIINLEPVIGVIYAPAKKRLFYSYGNGYSFEKFEQKKIQLECKKKTKLGEVQAVSHSLKPFPEILKTHKKFNVKNFIKMKSSYKFCVIATGEFDLYAALARAYEWDIAAGHAIVKHAGGIVTTLDEKEFKYGKTDYKNLTLLVRRSENLER
jgi:3'(2'), 5'-bisphosphate nucleotidase|tara:strand:+ start:1130 stop:1909 length:780 start_codon:yes stop_codon:yes gene_type:complete